MTDIIPRLRASDVRECIRRHFGPNGEKYAVLFEVRNGAAWTANRSVDSVVMSLWPSLGLELQGMEIKVARSDWLNELKNPQKSSDVFHHFDRWWLVAPADVAKIEEIPEPWGWLQPSGDRLAVIKQAPKNPNAKPCDRSFLSVLMRMTARRDGSEFTEALDKQHKEQRKQFERETEALVLKRMGSLKGEAEEWAKLRSLLDTQPDDFIYQPDVIQALRALLKSGVGKSYGGLRSLVAEVDRMKDSLGKIADELGIATDPVIPMRRKRRA